MLFLPGPEKETTKPDEGKFVFLKPQSFTFHTVRVGNFPGVGRGDQVVRL